MSEEQAKSKFGNARVARLASTAANGQPHLVPVTFALYESVIVIAVDHKPKSTTDLKRLRNIREVDRVSLIVDHYDDADWSNLWWVRADGRARVLEAEEDRATPVSWLVRKYPQYQAMAPAGPVIWCKIDTWRSWSYV